MLTMTFLGVGSAFAKRNYNANILFEFWEKEWNGPVPPTPPHDTLLVDFGVTGPLALYALKERPGFEYLKTSNGAINYPAIRKVFITHQHADHIGGLEEMALMNAFVFKDNKTGKPYKAEMISTINILVNLWDNSLKGGLNTIQHRYALLQDYFFIRALVPSQPEKNSFRLGPYLFEIFPTDHVHIERKYDWPSYGLFVTAPQSGGAVFYSGDTRFDYPAYAKMMEAAQICFHDCQLFDQQDAVHALLSECRTLSQPIRAKTVLYHFGDNFDDQRCSPPLPSSRSWRAPRNGISCSVRWRLHVGPIGRRISALPLFVVRRAAEGAGGYGRPEDELSRLPGHGPGSHRGRTVRVPATARTRARLRAGCFRSGISAPLLWRIPPAPSFHAQGARRFRRAGPRLRGNGYRPLHRPRD